MLQCRATALSGAKIVSLRGRKGASCPKWPWLRVRRASISCHCCPPLTVPVDFSTFSSRSHEESTAEQDAGQVYGSAALCSSSSSLRWKQAQAATTQSTGSGISQCKRKYPGGQAGSFQQSWGRLLRRYHHCQRAENEHLWRLVG